MTKRICRYCQHYVPMRSKAGKVLEAGECKEKKRYRVYAMCVVGANDKGCPIWSEREGR